MAFYINNVSQEVLSGYTFKYNLSEELDSGTIIIRSNDSTPILQFTNVLCENYGIVNNFLVLSDLVTAVVVGSVYHHQLALISPTILLNGYIINGCAFSNLNDTLLQQTQKAIIKANASGRIILSESLTSLLGTYPAREFRYSDTLTLRALLVDMFKGIGIVPSVKQGVSSLEDDIVIDYLSLENKGTTREINGLTGYKTYGGNQYGNISVTGRNAIANDAQKVACDWQTPITNGAILTTKNATIYTPTKIDKIAKVRLKGKITKWTEHAGAIGVTGSTIVHNNYDVSWDITPSVKEKNEYLLLDEVSVSMINNTEINRSNVLFYEQGEQAIEGFGNETNKTWASFLGTSTNIENLLAYYLFTYNASELSHSVTVDSFSLPELAFLIEYIPQTNIYANLSKNQTNANIFDYAVIDNQNSNSLSISNYGVVEALKIERLNNQETIYDCVVDNYTDIYSLGDIIDGNTICNIEWKYQNNSYTQVTYTCVKDYVNTNRQIEVNSTRRPTNIPLSGIIEREVLKKVQIKECATEKYSTMIHQLLASDYAYNKLLFSFDDGDEEVNHRYQKDAFCFGFANSICWRCEMMDNVSVGYSVGEKTNGGTLININKYCDDNGECESTILSLVSIKENDYSLSEIASISQSLPLIPSSVDYNDRYALQGFYNIDLSKDRFEKLIFTLQFEFVSSDDVYFSPAFASMNALLEGGGDRTYKVYASETELYNCHANDVKILGSLIKEIDGSDLVDGNTNEINPQIANIYISWAITYNDKLILARNGGTLYLDVI